jgi:hypothetical protein
MWWNLPGPTRFIERVLNALGGGESVVLLLPEHGPSTYGIRAEIAVHARQIATFEILATADGVPVEVLARRFDIEPGAWLTVGSLASSPQFRGRVLWLDGLTAASWPAWRDFIEEYRHASLAQPLLQRTLFIVALEGVLTEMAPTQDVGLQHFKWDDAVDRLDMWLFAAHLLRSRDLTARTRDLLVAVISHVALYDPEVARRLSHEPPVRVLDPESVLLEIAVERDWNRETTTHWRFGTGGTFQGTFREHSCQKVLNGQLDRRLWRAHVSVLFPEIEEFRQEFVRRYSGQWQIPHSSKFGVISTEFDLEIGHLKYQVKKLGLRVSPEELDDLERMVTARHSLAHLEKLDPQTILDLLS